MMNLYNVAYNENGQDYVQKVAASTKERAVEKFKQKMDSAERVYRIKNVILVITGVWC